jgi:hypothetical protein
MGKCMEEDNFTIIKQAIDMLGSIEMVSKMVLGSITFQKLSIKKEIGSEGSFNKAKF